MYKKILSSIFLTIILSCSTTNNSPVILDKAAIQTEKKNTKTYSCNKDNDIEIEIYSNNKNNSYHDKSKSKDFYSGEIPLEGVDVTLGNNKLVSDKNGKIIIKKDTYKNGDEIKFYKKDFMPFSYPIYSSSYCNYHLGLPSLNDEEKGTKIDFELFSFIKKETTYPSYFYKNNKGSEGYYIIRNKEQFDKAKPDLLLAYEFLDNNIEKLNKLEKEVLNKNKMLVIYIENTNSLGENTGGNKINYISENEKNIVLSYKPIELVNLDCFYGKCLEATGDIFALEYQIIALPYSDKKLKFNSFFE
ncbi:MAG: hypothetical protein U0457_06605 [Candidatus Sericytochromatia bacterium]